MFRDGTYDRETVNPNKPVGHPMTFSDLSCKLEDAIDEEAASGNDLIEKKLSEKYKTWDDLLEAVNHKICKNFNADTGTNWHSMEEGISDFLSKFKD